MQKNNSSPGFILVFSLILIAMLVVIVTQMANVSRVHRRYAATMADRQHAKMLACSGLQIAMAQLAIKDEPKSSSATDTGDKKDLKGKETVTTELWTDNEAKLFIKQILPLLHSWQEFTLTKKQDGVDGVIKVCICSEEGKLDINEQFDFNKRTFFDKNFIQEFFKQIDKLVGGKQLFKKFEQYLSQKKKFEQILKNRQNRLYDPTEFFDQGEKEKDFDVFQERVFYEPPQGVSKREIGGGGQIEGQKEGVKEPIYWTDIFTIWSGKKKINPWLFSRSIGKLFGLKYNEAEALATKQKKAEQLSKQFKRDLSWPGDWDTLFAKLYGIKYNNIPAWVRPIIDTTFAPTVFSVLSYGIVGNVTQKMYVIIERKKVQQDNKSEVQYEIKKFYWI